MSDAYSDSHENDMKAGHGRVRDILYFANISDPNGIADSKLKVPESN